LATTAHAEAAAHAGEQAAHGTPHIVNWVTLLARALGDSAASGFLIRYEKAIFSAIILSILASFSVYVHRRASLVPSKAQVIMESMVTALDDLVRGIIGPEGRKYTPFVGSLFIYIFVTNLFGLVPLQNSATAYITTTAALAACVFFYVQWIGITRNGIKGYIYHLAGSPTDFFGYLLIPINLPLHILGEFSKPLSLMFRLYGNIMAGHILVAVFLGLGLQMIKPLGVPVGVPLHFPFMFLEILVGTIQAFVFALLSTVYIAMMLPHAEHSEEGHA